MAKTQTSVHFEPVEIAWLREQAKVRKRSISFIVREAVMHYWGFRDECDRQEKRLAFAAMKKGGEG